VAKHKYIETPEKLESYWEEYKASVKSNPDMIAQLSNKGEIVFLPVEKPLQYNEFETFLNRAMVRDGYEYPLKTIRHYRDLDDSYSEYRQVVTRIESDWEADNVGGAMTGKYKAPTLIGRLHNIVETKNIHLSGEVSPFTPFDIDVPEDDSTG